ncbi:Smr/MutS family protein [Actibacterium sp. MT2.3-13A]|uniref:Smr/MutS family protein n=1 Tax=Actibacterium sp. MT2.3-13A TaxID=2828332 RepID=UPI001BA9E676|nr:Smr/MutS family protein [Actibacterium sp. MT2.3-13A]
MARRKPRGLSPEDRALWDKVAETATPLHPPKRRGPPEGWTPPPKPVQPTPPSRVLPDFRLGQSATPPPVSHDIAPELADRLAHAPVRMDRKSFTRMTRGKLSPEARIDLHGMTLARAHPTLTGFVLRAHAEGKRLVLVITGKGRRATDDGPIPSRPGVLKHQVPQWLTMPPLGGVVLQVTQAHQKHGGAGAYYVYLRRAR